MTQVPPSCEEAPITEQPGRQPFRDWHDGLFRCTNDCKSCWLITLFAPCYACYMYERYNECPLTACFMPATGLTLRAFHRGRERIHGTLCEDCMVSVCCSCCALCQLDRDMKYIEASRGYLDV
ncbi:unnamed protein product [Calicophoron daubneyi]|uniref:Uncharacterized protein n=1 Tax=Calicophoron daubneyi TaxID=300641 RepID=A0AAV2T8F6_CALDB